MAIVGEKDTMPLSIPIPRLQLRLSSRYLSTVYGIHGRELKMHPIFYMSFIYREKKRR